MSVDFKTSGHLWHMVGLSVGLTALVEIAIFAIVYKISMLTSGKIKKQRKREAGQQMLSMAGDVVTQPEDNEGVVGSFNENSAREEERQSLIDSTVLQENGINMRTSTDLATDPSREDYREITVHRTQELIDELANNEMRNTQHRLYPHQRLALISDELALEAADNEMHDAEITNQPHQSTAVLSTPNTSTDAASGVACATQPSYLKIVRFTKDSRSLSDSRTDLRPGETESKPNFQTADVRLLQVPLPDETPPALRTEESESEPIREKEGTLFDHTGFANDSEVKQGEMPSDKMESRMDATCFVKHPDDTSPALPREQ
ncbi:hypothetical protein BaRGS_00029696 [Batillaria attramentaria]|uniref:Uncharacterized protein n=1 Tax=Batillaria attramentaria TaxID=370345 RepID=A0ABD0JWF0_9CAEN